ncbi:J domain-containing protein [Pararobbsia silviterrae]|uniref:J domain-containing protein n=1 Tax=Pararobbsia silviterrae TaxID=1792498 RepID=A0A494XQ38_9BURK|nr:J domain-containing protein [Pararobbsia silviterrae]RKP51821.1 J domain-containing protein [Pararobbsia silviterrae]
MTTLYDTLGVNEHASPDELKRAYRKATMKWHPDRNAGNEAAAHAAFQEVKAAYAILSDPAQREEYDTIFAAEMRRWTERHEAEDRARAARERAERERTEREAREQAAAQARYAEHVASAMRHAAQGYNRDVVFGVLLGRGCDAAEAQRIADSVSAWHGTHADVNPDVRTADAVEPNDIEERAQSASTARGDRAAMRVAPAGDADRADTSRAESPRKTAHARKPAQTRPATSPDNTTHDTHAETPAHLFGTLWYHFLNGLKP